MPWAPDPTSVSLLAAYVAYKEIIPRLFKETDKAKADSGQVSRIETKVNEIDREIRIMKTALFGFNGNPGTIAAIQSKLRECELIESEMREQITANRYAIEAVRRRREQED